MSLTLLWPPEVSNTFFRPGNRSFIPLSEGASEHEPRNGDADKYKTNRNKMRDSEVCDFVYHDAATLTAPCEILMNSG